MMHYQSSFLMILATSLSSILPIAYAATSEGRQDLYTKDYEPHRSAGTIQLCGFRQPSSDEFWNHGVVEKFVPWMNYNWENYKNSTYPAFIDYMIGEFAPDVPKSALQCDGLGSCSIGSCNNIAHDLSPEDRQMAYYAFEQISNIDHIYKVIYHATLEATQYLKDRREGLIGDFSYANVIGLRNFKRQRRDQLVTTLTLTALAIVSQALGPVNSIAVPMMLQEVEAIVNIANLLVHPTFKSSFGIASGLIGITNNLYVSFNNNPQGFFHNGNVPGTYDSLLMSVLGSISHVKLQQVWKEMHRIMNDRTLTNSNITQGTTLSDLLKSGAFIEFDPGLRGNFTSALEKTFLSVAVDTLWSIDRTYILDTDESNSIPCAKDMRGPERNRVCLPERPGHVYWLYDINGGKEGDTLGVSDALISSPAGLRKFIESPSSWKNITKEDIVRSSLWAQENNLVGGERRLADRMPTQLIHNGTLPGGELAGAFSIPVCRNPRGEAISSVWARKGRNYPCMCGEFAWGKDGGYSPEIDQTKSFAHRTGFAFSEDWRHYCSVRAHCTKDREVDWIFPENGAPNQMHYHALHPYKYCKAPKPHWRRHKGKLEHLWGHPEKDI